MPDAAVEKTAIGRLFDRAAASYEQIGHPLFVPAGKALVAVAELRPGHCVLDVGCGRGASLFPALDVVGEHGCVTGIDLAPAMVEATKADIARRGIRNAGIRVADAESPPFPARTFDAVLAGFVLFFLPDPAAALDSFARLLRPGGRLAVSTFADPSERETEFTRMCTAAVAPYLAPRSAPPGNQPLQRLRTAQSLAALLQAAGFTDAQSSQRDFDCPAESWYWLWSGGLHGLIAQVPAESRDAARDVVRSAVAELSGPAGSRVTGAVRFTTARLPS